METLYRKYRPQTFADVAAQGHVTTTIQNQLRSGRVAHAYLFTGPRGVGKTTMARLIAKAVNCVGKRKKDDVEPCNACPACLEITNGASLDVYEIDAASHTGVGNVRENIIESVRFAPNKLKYKVYIIDEVHMLSTSAFNALLKTLEEPPAHALFILATTEIHKVPLTIISRCQRFDFKRIPATEMVARLKLLCKEEGFTVADDVLFAIARNAEGCERDAESLLGQLFAIGEKKIGMEEASLVLPAAHMASIAAFAEAVAKREAATALRLLNEQLEQGMEMGVFLDAVVAFLRTLLFASLGGLERFADEYDDQTMKRLKEIGAAFTPFAITDAIEKFLDARRSTKTDMIPQLSAELAVMKLCQDAPRDFSSPRVASSPPQAQTTPLSSPPRGGENAAVPAPTHEEEDERADLAEAVVETPAPEPLVAEATVFDSVPVISLEEVQKKWPEVFQQIQECNASLPLIIQSGEVSSVVGDVVEMRFNYSLHAETLNRQKNKVLVEQVIARVLGRPIRLKAIHEPGADEAADALMQEFGGQVI